MTTAVSTGEQGATALPSQNIQQMTEFVLKRNTSYACFYIYPSSDQLYVWFNTSGTILLVNKHGEVTNTVTLQPGLDEKYEIHDVCVSPVDGTLWSVCGGTVQQVTKDGMLLQSFTQEFAVSVCVTRCQSVLVRDAWHDDLKILTTSGKLTMALTQQDIGLSDCPYYTVECPKTGHVAITDYKAVSVLDEEYRQLYILHGDKITTADNETKSTGYKHKVEFHPYSMCFDREGDLLVCDINNYSVILFSSSGQYIRIILQETDKDKSPHVVNTAPDGTLWVGHNNDVFKQINYK